MKYFLIFIFLFFSMGCSLKDEPPSTSLSCLAVEKKTIPNIYLNNIRFISHFSQKIKNDIESKLYLKALKKYEAGYLYDIKYDSAKVMIFSSIEKLLELAHFYREFSFLNYKVENYKEAYQFEIVASRAFLKVKKKLFSKLSYQEKSIYFNSGKYSLHRLIPMAYLYLHNKRVLKKVPQRDILLELKNKLFPDRIHTSQKEKELDLYLSRLFASNDDKVNHSSPKKLHKNISEAFMLWLQIKGEASNLETYLFQRKNMLLHQKNITSQERIFLNKIDLIKKKKDQYAQLFIQKISSSEDEPFSKINQVQMEQIGSEIKRLERTFNQELNLARDIDMISIEQLALSDISKLLYQNELYIDFVNINHDYYIFTLNNKKELSLYYIKDMDSKIKYFRKKIKEKVTISEIKKIGSQLYKTIFCSIKGLEKYKNLIISPDGMINLLPFEALYTKNHHYLIEDKNIQYIASGRDFYKYREKNGFEYRKKNKNIIVLADLDYDTGKSIHPCKPLSEHSEETKLLTDLINDRRLKKLSASKVEGESILDTFGKNTVSLYTDKEGTKKLLYMLNSPMILHLSTHSFYAKESTKIVNPLLKVGLALSEYNAIYKKGNNRGLMTALEFSSLNLDNTELVFFSSCQSGLGDMYNAEGVLGLNRGAKMAGAKRVISTLWSVADKESFELSRSFYQHLHKSTLSSIGNIAKNDILNYHEALKKAKLEMIKKHPFYWAGFVLYGVDALKSINERKETQRFMFQKSRTEVKKEIKGKVFFPLFQAIIGEEEMDKIIDTTLDEVINQELIKEKKK